jgi:hypothetical protein
MVMAAVALGVAAVTLAQATWAATMLGALLVWQGLGHGLAPLNSLAAIRADLPPELRRRRREKLRAMATGTPVRRAAWSSGVLAAAGLALVALAAPTTSPTLPDVESPLGQDEPSTVVGPVTPTPSGSPRPARTPGTPAASVAEVAATTTVRPAPAAGRREPPTADGTAQARPSAARPTARATVGPATRPATRATAGPTAAARPTQAPEPARPARSTPAPAAPSEPARSPTSRPSGQPTSPAAGRSAGS